MMYMNKSLPNDTLRRPELQFPGKLHDMLEYVEHNGFEAAISWTMNGRGITINNPDRLVDILPLFFGQTKYRSFRRQLNMWHFDRIMVGPDKGTFTHPYFLKGQKSLCALMSRHIDPKAPLTMLTTEVKPIASTPLSNTGRTSTLLSTSSFQDVSTIRKPSVDDATSKSSYASQVTTLPSKSPELFEFYLPQPTMEMLPEIPLIAIESSCPGMSEPASPELVESIYSDFCGSQYNEYLPFQSI